MNIKIASFDYVIAEQFRDHANGRLQQQQARRTVTIPDWDPPGFGDVAILERLDKNGDGFADKGELAEAPGLAFGARYIDKNRDRQTQPRGNLRLDS